MELLCDAELWTELILVELGDDAQVRVRLQALIVGFGDFVPNASVARTEDEGPAAGYVTLNEPLEQSARIEAALAGGLIVRTRADADTLEARANDRARQTAAFASGAQYVSTDYLKPDARFGPYEVHLPGGGVARLNPKMAK